MYKILQPVKTVGSYQIPEQSDDQTPVVRYMQNPQWLEPEKLAEFIGRNPSQINNIIPWIPTPVLVDMSRGCNFLGSRMTPALLELNRKYSEVRSTANRDLSEFIKLNDRIGKHYNFATSRLKHALQQVPDCNGFWIVGQSVLDIASEGPKRIQLVSKSKKLQRLGRQMHKIDHGFIIQQGPHELAIDSEYTESAFALLFGRKTDIILDPETLDCYCTFELYQKISTERVPNTIDHQQQLSPTEFTSFCLKKFHPKFPDHRMCYVCKTTYPVDLYYRGYWSMCMKCGFENHLKAQETTDLSKTKALVTGCRHKIGLATCLKLLRCGARVVGTTRYPALALANYKSEPDYQAWKDHLELIGCDFTKIQQVEELIRYVEQNPGFNCFINNACQTVRGSQWYTDTLRNLEVQTRLALDQNPETKTQQESQLVLAGKLNQFKDITDINANQVCSWYSPLEAIEPSEILEVTVINQIIPTLLFQQLKPFLQEPRFMIEVTAVEGQFYASKNNKHPHTNACKAAMNMLIRTMSEEYNPQQFVYAIDPGYVSGVPQALMTRFPLTSLDGASRILDPLIQHAKGKPLPRDHVHLKNYRKCEW